MADEAQAFHDAVDWVSVVEKRKKEIKTTDDKGKRLEKLLDQRDARMKDDLKPLLEKCERLQKESNRLMKRILWFEEREKRERERERV